jgi:hypothetical protein
MDAELTIVLAAHDADLLPRLLNTLDRQDYAGMSEIRILVAGTAAVGTVCLAGRESDPRIELVRMASPLRVEEPGLGIARNAGARMATTPYLLFLDGDSELPDSTLIRRTMETVRQRGLHLATSGVVCRHGGFLDDMVLLGGNAMQRMGRRPFAVGTFLLFERETFWRLGGFNERAVFGEEYLLARSVSRERFAVVPGKVITSGRRLRTAGHARAGWVLLQALLGREEDGPFLREEFVRPLRVDRWELGETMTGERFAGDEGRWREAG